MRGPRRGSPLKAPPKVVPGELIFEVDLPPRELSPNGQHGHWSTQATGREVYREEVGLRAAEAARRAGWQAPRLARVSLVFYTGRGGGRGYRPRDIPNAVSAFKAGFDGLVDAKVIVDDDYKHMQLGTVRIDTARGGVVAILVEAIE